MLQAPFATTSEPFATSLRTFTSRLTSLGAEQLQQFQLHLLRDQKLATGTVENRMTSLHFFFKKVLKRYDPELYDMQLTRVPKKLPVVLSAEEVEKLIAAAPNIRYRTILLLLYATGLRRAEAAQLRIADIDSQRMIIHVHAGKNSRDRELPLTPKLLEALRAYWRASKVKPKVYLFPTRFKKTDEERPVTDKAVWHACRASARRAGLSKRLGPHQLRHYAGSRTIPGELKVGLIGGSLARIFPA